MILFGNEYKVLKNEQDEEGRMIIAAITNEDMKIITTNVYFPNDHKEAIKFTESVYEKILEFQHEHTDFDTICAGDYNACMTKEDSLNRIGTNCERHLATAIKENNKIVKLTDAFRLLHKEDGFTWRRGSCYSRLDHIFVSDNLIRRINKAEVDWSFETSDHAAVKLELKYEEDPIKGPGITNVNIKILEDPVKRMEIETEISEMMKQVEPHWNPHTVLEFLKVTIRTVIAEKTGETRKSMNKVISELEEENNQIEEMRLKAIKETTEDPEERIRRINPLTRASDSLNGKLATLRKKLCETREFASKVKWFEFGEKSNKFFLNLTKNRQKQKLINTIRNENQIHNGQNEVMNGIKSFYQKLYESKTLEQGNPDDFYKNCPKLDEEQRNFMDQNLTIEELCKALSTCKESSPGPDGITYLVYKKLWKVTAPIILASWNYSMATGILPPSHLESVITLLPKEGKDTKEIKNWRPITLSNCDSKIITKALSIRTSKILESIIDKAQTAYVPGRAVADNLRTNFYFKKKCSDKKIEAALISLDAKKAFDSVDHKYIEETLKHYGFGPIFINMFKVLYRDLTARIMVNGFMTESIKIKRGVKQGDALSCAIFIICIDPLLRNLNSNEGIIPAFKVGKATFKAAAYADDISIICRNDSHSIKQVFVEYERLTKKSGLELNADKTEILNLNPNSKTRSYKISYNKCNFEIQPVQKIKICGLVFANDPLEEYNQNVITKINKLEMQIKLWSHRRLTLEGKSLIVKTFGLSQIIYNMQCYAFEKKEIILTERIIFGFLWSTSESRGIDRIKRSVMKNEISKGGMKICDVECLQNSLKLRQFIRANESKHAIAEIQQNLTKGRVLQEYHKITDEESICNSAQKTINLITDHNRKCYERTMNKITEEEQLTDRHMINEVSSINLKTFLMRKGKVFLVCILNPLASIGIVTLADLIQRYEYEQDRNIIKSMEMVLRGIPTFLIRIAKYYIEDINSDTQEVKTMQINEFIRKDIITITTGELQMTLKRALNKIDDLNVMERNNIDYYDYSNIVTFRKNCKNAKLRNIYFRMINGDFYSNARMKKFKMIETDKCSRCEQVEDTKHLLWECFQSKNIWSLFNEVMRKTGNLEKVTSFEEIFVPGLNSKTCLIKILIIQELIQIERPINWRIEKLLKLIQEAIKVDELINHQTTNKWKHFKTLIETTEIINRANEPP
jgi:hypothetical protein